VEDNGGRSLGEGFEEYIIIYCGRVCGKGFGEEFVWGYGGKIW
jgi:hypothetical protein